MFWIYCKVQFEQLRRFLCHWRLKSLSLYNIFFEKHFKVRVWNENISIMHTLLIRICTSIFWKHIPFANETIGNHQKLMNYCKPLFETIANSRAARCTKRISCFWKMVFRWLSWHFLQLHWWFNIVWRRRNKKFLV